MPTMDFIVSGLAPETFSHLFGKSDSELEAMGIRPSIVDGKPGAPCRVSLRELEPGTRVLLLNHCHLEVESPYRSAHAIYVADGATAADHAPGELPEVIVARTLISVRAFDDDGMMLDARLVNGPDAGAVFRDMLSRQDVAYLHAHTAARGCFLARVDRA
jgi:hypothetical protein